MGDRFAGGREDDGRGLPSAAETVPGVGIANARARLERMYGSAARLSVRNAADAPGAVVEISLPLRTSTAAAS